MGWERYASTIQARVDNLTFDLTGIAEKRGLVAFLCLSSDGRIPDYATRRKIEAQVTKTAFEHIIIYADAGRKTQVWQWVRREAGKPAASREHTYHVQQTGEALIQKLQAIVFSLEEEESLSTVSVAGRVRVAFDVERITKRFYDRFKTEHDQFLSFTEGIPDKEIQRWYASVMINRLMFIYFIQKKGFLDSDINYLRTRLSQSKRRGRDLFYSDLLCPLFFEGFAKKESERSAGAKKLLGKVPYLNGGLFLKHQIEEKYGHTLKIRDSAFAKLFDFFDGYQWHLDERPLRQDNEINPDVLGYIFEKYINQKQMGAYYSKEDITDYIGKSTIIPFIFDKAREKCRIAFEGDHSIWRVLQVDPHRYIYAAIKKGVDLDLPNAIAKGLEDVSKRTDWNKLASDEYALPTEIWREVVARRNRYQEINARLAAGEVRDVNDLVTYNLDIRQFAQDAIQDCEGPELLRALWHAIERVTVLDPACGSGAFLFAALNILEPLYEACLNRMQVFMDELERSGEKHRPEKFGDFRKVLERVALHPNARYFILKSIIINNLFGVDIMEEATEICKLRLFLKLVAQVERDEQIEPLPDIDFNIRAGNTLVGYATFEDVRKGVGGQLDFEDAMSRIEEKAQDVDRLFGLFRQQQTEVGGEVAPDNKKDLRRRLGVLEDELNSSLSSQYGLKSNKGEKYDSWLHSHKPFHWFIDFHSIMQRGGFDVVIGNPPYVERRVIQSQYSTQNFSTAPTNNLFAYFVERAEALLYPGARFGFIVPLSSMSTDKFQPLQNIVIRQSHVWLSNFDDRPARLFDGLEHIQLTIILFQSKLKSINRCEYSTRCFKWSAVERPVLFSELQYIRHHSSYLSGSVPKVGTALEVSILDKLWSKNSGIYSYVVSVGGHSVFYTRKVHAFLNVLDFVPDIRSSNGKRRDPSEQKTLEFSTKVEAAAILCVLNSTLFRWFLTTFSDCRNVNRREVLGFRVDLPLLLSTHGKELESLARRLSDSLKTNSDVRTMRFGGETLRVQCIIPKHSKSIIDAIDRVLAKHYGFTDEELDFIINYDIKYRMGLGTDLESEE